MNKITPNEYQQGCLRTEPSESQYVTAMARACDPKVFRLLHCAMGLVTEAGELMEALKKYIFYGKPLDHANAMEEIGDSSWYAAIGADALERKLEEILTRNLSKLKTRYPEKFTEDSAINRDTEKERSALMGGYRCQDGSCGSCDYCNSRRQ